VIVGIGLPQAPSISLQGSGDIALIDLKQHALEVNIKGSGNVTASGTATSLDVDIAGSGDVDARELITTDARLSIAGSGDIEAFVRFFVRARCWFGRYRRRRKSPAARPQRRGIRKGEVPLSRFPIGVG